MSRFWLNRVHEDRLVFKKTLKNFFNQIIFKMPSRNYMVVFLILMAGSIALRAYFMTHRPLGYDEVATTKYFADVSLTKVLSSYHQPNNHVFHSFWVHLFVKSFGDHLWAIRFPAFFFGIVSLLLLYACARQLYSDPNVALWSLALASVSGVMVCYSTNARGYTLQTVFFLCQVFLGDYLLRKNNIAAWFWFCVVSVLGMYTIPTMIYPILTVFAWMQIRAMADSSQSSFKMFLSLLICGIVIVFGVFLVYLPILWRYHFVFSDLPLVQQLQVKLSYPQFFKLLFSEKVLEYFNFFHKGFGRLGSLLLTVGAVIGCAFHRKVSLSRVPILIVALCVCLFLVCCQRVLPYDRIFTPFIPVYLMFASAGLVFIFNKIFSNYSSVKKTLMIQLTAIFVFLFIGFGIIMHPYPIYYDSRIVDAPQMMKYLKKILQPQDRLLIRFESGWDREVFNYQLLIHGLHDWEKDYDSDPNLDYNQIQNLGGVVYAFEFHNGNHCYKTYHCDQSWDLPKLLSVSKGSHLDAQLIKKFDHTDIYKVSSSGK